MCTIILFLIHQVSLDPKALGQADTLEKEIATHSSILAQRIPWAKEPDGLQFVGSQKVRRDWSDLARVCVCVSFFSCFKNFIFITDF